MSAPRYTPEFVERGYNNRAAVPDHPEWFLKFAQQSAIARERYRPTLDLRFGPNPKETLDLFVPAGTPRGTFVFIHGGYWRALDKADHLFVAGPLVEAGMAVACINYDLCPAVRIETIVDECRRALLWVQREGPRHGADPANVVVGGHSAGGHLAAMMLATDWSAHGLAREPFVGGVTLSGVHDLLPMVQFSFNADFHLDEAQARSLSPAFLASRSRAPLLSAVGGKETSEFIRQAHLMWDAWPQNRKPSGGAMVIPDRHHFDVIFDYADAQSALSRATLALF